MKSETFNILAEELFGDCVELLVKKGEEYTPDNEDRLGHFYKAATKLGVSPVEALLGEKVKHTVSIDDLVQGTIYGHPILQQRLRERFMDEINYLVLLYALIQEEAIFQSEKTEHEQ